MGLDIYLKEIPNIEKIKEIEEKAELFSNKIWEELGDYKKLTDEQKDQAREKIKLFNQENNCDEWGSNNDRRRIENNSAKYPDHLFKVGYFRSSYNDAGINRKLSNSIGKDLYWIFSREREDEYEFKPDWQEVRKRVEQVQKELADHIENVGGVSCYAESHNLFLERNGFPQCCYIVYKDRDGWTWYLQALEIILETCDFVDKHSNKEDLYLAWSS